MKASDFLGGDFIKKEDLQDEDILVQIKNVEAAEFVDKQTAHIEKRLQLVLGIDKKLTLNSTNTKILVKRFGNDTNAWIGKTITLYYDESVSYAGRLTGGIRIRLPKARPVPVQAPEADWINEPGQAEAPYDEPGANG